MKFRDASTISSRMVALSGLLSLAATREAPDWLVLPAIVLAAAGILLPNRPSRPVLSKKTLTLLASAAIAFSVLDFLYIGGSLITAGADLLVALLILKLLSCEEEKDHFQLFAVSFFLLLASTALSTDIYFLPCFLMFFVSLTWALILVTVRGEAEAISGRPPRWDVGISFFGGTAALTLLATVFTLAIFLIIPRVGIGYFSKRAGGLLMISGFSDRVELGSMGRVKLDPTEVMRVRLPGVKGRPAGRHYWRGRAFDFYDGSAWNDTLTRKAFYYRTPSGFFYFTPPDEDPGAAVVQDILLEPLDTATLFALYPAARLSGDFRQMFIDQYGGLRLTSPPGGRLHYTVYSTPRTPSKEELSVQETGLPEGLERQYLQLPYDSKNIADLSARVAGDAGTPYEKTVRILRSLAGYAYSLDPPRDTAYTPVDDFLFHSKSGYCQHFATAMTLMLRASGVPARIVSGFAGGQWNDYGGYFSVREQDAHTWVEVFFPDSGWVVFDPTPDEAFDERPASLIRNLSGMMDYIRYRWDTYIVFFNLRDQVGALRDASAAYNKARLGIARTLAGITERLGQLSLSGYRPRGAAGPASLAGFFLLLAAAYYIIFMRSRRRGRFGKKGAVPFYEDMIKILKKRGMARPAGVTPLEFARGLAALGGGPYEDVSYITGLYNRVRFGGIPANRAELEKVRLMLEGLKRDGQSAAKGGTGQ